MTVTELTTPAELTATVQVEARLDRPVWCCSRWPHSHVRVIPARPFDWAIDVPELAR